MTSNASKRAALRDLARESRGLRSLLRVSRDVIRLTKDTDLFRLALIYESIKDQRPDAREALAAVTALCQAARDADLDPDPYLKEVAAVSNDLDREGHGSMRAWLFAEAARGGSQIRCPKCEGTFSTKQPTCPHCGAASLWHSVKPSTPKAPVANTFDDIPVAYDAGSNDVILFYIATPKLLAYLAMLLAALAFLVLGCVLAACSYVIPDFFTTKSPWIMIGVMVMIWLGLRYVGFVKLAQRYAPAHGRTRLGITWKQMFLIFAIILGIVVSAVTTVNLTRDW